MVLLGPSCVAHDAGYADSRRFILDRTTSDVRWRAVDSGGRTEAHTRRLLGKPLSVEAAVQVALFNNPDVQGAFEELGLARADLLRALRLPNPVAQAAVHYHTDNPDIEVGALIRLSDLLFLPMRSGAAHAGLDAAKLAVAGAVLDLAFEVRVAYFRYVAARQIVELRRTVLLAVNSSYESAKALHEAGNIADLDLANERALYEDARLLVARAETEGVTERAQLGSLLGISGSGMHWKAAERLPDADISQAARADVERRALARSIDLEHARQRFTVAAKRANLARAEGLVPELQAGVVAENESDEGWGIGPAVQIEVPLFYHGAGEVARARSEMRRQQNVYSAAALRIRAAVQDAGARFETARSALAFYRDVQLPLREQIVEQTERQLNAMNVSVFQLLLAKRDQIETARAYIETQRDYWIAKAEIDQLLAGRLPPVRISPADGMAEDRESQSQAGGRH